MSIEEKTINIDDIPFETELPPAMDEELPELSDIPVGAAEMHEPMHGSSPIRGLRSKVIYTRDFSFLAPYFNSMGEWSGPEWSGLDIETEVRDRPDIGPGWKSGLNPVHTAIATIQLEVADACYVVHWGVPEGLSELSPGNLITVPDVGLFRRYLKCQAVTKCIHNAEFEYKFLLNELGLDLCLEPIWDTKLGEFILAEGRGFTATQGKYWVAGRGQKPKGHLTLGECIERRYGVALDKGFDVRLSFKRGSSLTERQIKYAADDALWCRMLAEDQYADMEKISHEQGISMLTTMERDCQAIEAVGRMVLHGMFMEIDEAGCLLAEFTARMGELTEIVRQTFWLPGDGDPVMTPTGKKQKVKGGLPVFNTLNLNSHDQMVPRLQQFGLPVTSYQKDELKLYKRYEGIDELLEIKTLDKLSGTYLEPFLMRHIHPRYSRMYCNLNLANTVTGRLSSSKPNLQNIPIRGKLGPLVRRLFKAPKGYVLVGCDYSNIELKLIAEVFGDPTMIRAFMEGIDLHALVGAVILYDIQDMSWDNLMTNYSRFKAIHDAGGNKDHIQARQGGKATNFGLGFGAGARVLQAQTWRDYDIWWELDKCYELRRRWLTLWSGVKSYHYKVGRILKATTGPVPVSTIGGRRRWIDPYTGYSEYLNFCIQGSSAEMTKDAMNRTKRDINLVLQVHDALYAEVKEEEAEAGLTYLREEMIAAGRGYLRVVPCTVDGKILQRWEK